MLPICLLSQGSTKHVNHITVDMCGPLLVFPSFYSVAQAHSHVMNYAKCKGTFRNSTELQLKANNVRYFLARM